MAQVCNHYGIRLTRDGRLIDEDKTDKLFMKVYQKGQLVLEEKVQDQVTINTEAKDIIKDLFPNIPDQDLFKIIKTAFQLGDGKVGTAEEIPLHRRATLAVVAHIRHVYTMYDKLLRKMPYNSARHEVEAQTLEKLVAWRGQGQADEGAMNEILDDVIVISDAEDSDIEPEGARRVPEADLRVEELDGDAYWPTAARPLSPSRVLIDDPSLGYRFLPQTVQPYRPSEAELAVRERNRAARWEQARQQYHTALSRPGPSYQRVIAREPSPVRHLIPIDPPQPPRVIQREYLGPAPHRLQEVEVGKHPSYIPEVLGGTLSLSQASLAYHTDAIQVRSRPGSPIYPRPTQAQYERVVDSYRAPPMFQPQPRPLTPNGPRYRRRSISPGGGDGTIRPSIEGPNGAYSPSLPRRNDEARMLNAQGSADYRDRRDPLLPMGAPAVNYSSSDHVRSRWVEGEVASSSAHDNPLRSPREPPRMIRDISPPSTGAEPRSLELNPARRMLIPEGEPSYDYVHSQPLRRLNPFEDRSGQQMRRFEPLPNAIPPYEALRRPIPETPPRRILEPIPADDPYSDTGPQRYREYMAVSEPYHASAPSITYPSAERRIVYANSEDYVVDRRYEAAMKVAIQAPPYPNPFNGFTRPPPLPETGYARR